MRVQAVILSAGAGERAFPLSAGRAKPMFEFLGKPLLQYVIENLQEARVEDLIIVTGPNPQEIQSYFGTGERFGVKIRYTRQEKPLGMANALQTAQHLLEDRFFMLNGNDISEPYLLTEVMKKAEETGGDMVLVGREMEKPWKFGVFKFDDGSVTAVVEKPPVTGFTLKGVLRGDRGVKALLEYEMDMRTHIVGVGELVGSTDVEVVEITEEGVVITRPDCRDTLIPVRYQLEQDNWQSTIEPWVPSDGEDAVGGKNY